ncbi:hypothetical protein YN1_8400 [Nanoarchaeota archaeon]
MKKNRNNLLRKIKKIVDKAIEEYIKETGNYISAKELKNRKRK